MLNQVRPDPNTCSWLSHLRDKWSSVLAPTFIVLSLELKGDCEHEAVSSSAAKPFLDLVFTSSPSDRGWTSQPHRLQLTGKDADLWRALGILCDNIDSCTRGVPFNQCSERECLLVGRPNECIKTGGVTSWQQQTNLVDTRIV